MVAGDDESKGHSQDQFQHRPSLYIIHHTQSVTGAHSASLTTQQGQVGPTACHPPSTSRRRSFSLMNAALASTVVERMICPSRLMQVPPFIVTLEAVVAAEPSCRGPELLCLIPAADAPRSPQPHSAYSNRNMCGGCQLGGYTKRSRPRALRSACIERPEIITSNDQKQFAVSQHIGRGQRTGGRFDRPWVCMVGLQQPSIAICRMCARLVSPNNRPSGTSPGRLRCDQVELCRVRDPRARSGLPHVYPSSPSPSDASRNRPLWQHAPEAAVAQT